nr:PREDICTED: uncharacterized protein LOC109040715 [Bemisia tabaci]
MLRGLILLTVVCFIDGSPTEDAAGAESSSLPLALPVSRAGAGAEGERASGGGGDPGQVKSAVTTSKLPAFPLPIFGEDPRPSPGDTRKLMRVPKNLVRGLKEAMEAVRRKQETLIAHLECSLGAGAVEACDAQAQRPPEVKLDWTTYVADDQTPYLLEINHFFKGNPVDLPLEIVTPVMQMFNGAVTEIYIKQRYISSLFEQAVCSISRTCEKPKPTRKPYLKEEDRDRIFPSIYEWVSNLFQFQLPKPPVFAPPSYFANLKPCRNETISGSYNNGTGFYYSQVLEYGKNCTQYQHSSNSVAPPEGE